MHRSTSVSSFDTKSAWSESVSTTGKEADQGSPLQLTTLQKKKNEFEKAFFGVLFAMIRQTKLPSNKFMLFTVVIDLLQLLSFNFMNVPWQKGVSFYIGHILQFTLLPIWLVKEAYTVVYWITTTLLIISIGDALLVYYTFQKEHHAKWIWPIKVLRFFVGILVTVMYIPIFKIELSVCSCRFFSSGECYGIIHIMYIFVSVFVILCFMSLALLTALVFYDPDPTSKHLLARPYARIDFVYLLLKTIIAIVSVVAYDHPEAIVLTNLFLALTMLVLLITFLPYYKIRTNYLFIGLHSLIAWFAFGGSLSFLMPYHDVLLWIFLGIAPIICTSAVLGAKYRYHRLVSLKDIVDNAHPFKFMLATDIEIATRFIHKTQAPGLMETAQGLYSKGLEQFPKSSLLYLAYTNFCFAFMGKNERVPYVYLDRLRHLEPPFDIRFFIYKKDAELKQREESNSLGTESSLDLVSYIEFQNNYKNARSFHHKALRAIRSFWRLLLQDHVNLMDLPKAFRQIDTAESKALQHYTQLLNRYPKSVRILRSYAQFQEEVLNDPQLADHYYMAADMLEDENSRQRAQNDNDSQSESEAQYITSHTKVDSNDLMIMIDKCGIIKDVNKNCKLFGYSIGDLMEKPINNVIPEPFRKEHDQFLYNYLTTGRAKIIGMGGRQLPFLQKDGSLASVLLSVTKVAIGNEFVFVGLIKKLKEGLVGVDKDGSIIFGTQPFTAVTEWEHKRLAENNMSLIIPDTDTNRASQLFGFLENGRVTPRPGEALIEISDASGQNKQFECTTTGFIVKGDWLYTLLLSPVIQGTPSKFETDSASCSDAQSQQGEVSAGTIREIRNERRTQYNKKYGNHFSSKFRRFTQTHQKLSSWNLWGTIVLALLAVISYIGTMILLNQLASHNDLVGEFGKRTKISQDICVGTRSLSLAETQTEFKKMQKDLKSEGQHFKDIHSQLFEHEKYHKTVTVAFLLDENQTTKMESSLFDLGNTIVQHTQILASAANVTSFVSDYIDDIFFIIENCGTFLTSFDGAMWTQKNTTDKSWTSLLTLHSVIFGLAGLILIGLGIHVLKITFFKIHNERNTTLGLFLNIPREAVSELAQRGLRTNDLDEAKAPSQQNSFADYDIRKFGSQESIQELQEIPQYESNQIEDISEKECVVRIEEPERKPVPILKNANFIIPSMTSPLSTARGHETHTFLQRTYLQSPLLRKLASQYLLALILIAVLFFPPIYVTFAFDDVKQTRLTEIALASRRESLTLHTVWLMDEITYNDTMDISNSSWILIQQASAQLKDLHSALVFGSNKYGIEGYGSWSSKQHFLMFEECLLENQKECKNPTEPQAWATDGLNTLFVHFLESINLFAEEAAHWTDSTNSEHFMWIKNNTHIINKALGKSKEYYQEQADAIFRVYNIIYTVLFFVSLILFVVIHIFGFKTITKILINESKRTRSMLLMIPPAVVDNSEELQAYLAATHVNDGDEF